MSPTPKYVQWGGIIAVAFVGAIIAYTMHLDSSTDVPKDYTLPNDNFDQATMKQIKADIAQYQVAQTPHDHAVYMVTGGIGVANPRILGWDSDGNIVFGFNGPPGMIYQIREFGQNPMTWRQPIAHGHVNLKTKRGMTFTYKPLHWILHHTSTGLVYYKLDNKSQAPQYFFRHRNSYIFVVPFPNDVFPTGLMSHLVAVGNPVKK